MLLRSHLRWLRRTTGALATGTGIDAAGDGLEPGMEAQIAIASPFLLDGRIRLQLVLDSTITGSQDGVAEARILAYDFRTRR